MKVVSKLLHVSMLNVYFVLSLLMVGLSESAHCYDNPKANRGQWDEIDSIPSRASGRVFTSCNDTLILQYVDNDPDSNKSTLRTFSYDLKSRTKQDYSTAVSTFYEVPFQGANHAEYAIVKAGKQYAVSRVTYNPIHEDLYPLRQDLSNYLSEPGVSFQLFSNPIKSSNLYIITFEIFGGTVYQSLVRSEDSGKSWDFISIPSSLGFNNGIMFDKITFNYTNPNMVAMRLSDYSSTNDTTIFTTDNFASVTTMSPCSPESTQLGIGPTLWGLQSECDLLQFYSIDFKYATVVDGDSHYVPWLDSMFLDSYSLLKQQGVKFNIDVEHIIVNTKNRNNVICGVEIIHPKNINPYLTYFVTEDGGKTWNCIINNYNLDKALQISIDESTNTIFCAYPDNDSLSHTSFHLLAYRQDTLDVVQNQRTPEILNIYYSNFKLNIIPIDESPNLIDVKTVSMYDELGREVVVFAVPPQQPFCGFGLPCELPDGMYLVMVDTNSTCIMKKMMISSY